MSQRSKNLLEAFNQSKAPEKSAEPVAQPRGSAPRVGGPFADSAPSARPAQGKLYDGRSADGAQSPGQRWRVVSLCVGIAALFFFVGRLSAPSVKAADTSTSAIPQAPPSAPPSTPAPAPVKSSSLGNDVALLDPKNQATILAATYTKYNDETQQLATAAKASLIAQDLPASISRNPDKGRIYLLVGAAPKTTDLDLLLTKVKAAKTERGKKEFADAGLVLIDTYVVRKTH